MRVLARSEREFFLKYDDRHIYDNEIAKVLDISINSYTKLLRKFKAFRDVSDDKEHYFKTRKDVNLCVKFIEGVLESGNI